MLKSTFLGGCSLGWRVKIQGTGPGRGVMGWSQSFIPPKPACFIPPGVLQLVSGSGSWIPRGWAHLQLQHELRGEQTEQEPGKGSWNCRVAWIWRDPHGSNSWPCTGDWGGSEGWKLGRGCSSLQSPNSGKSFSFSLENPLESEFGSSISNKQSPEPSPTPGSTWMNLGGSSSLLTALPVSGLFMSD